MYNSNTRAKKKQQNEIFEARMTEISPKLILDINPQIQKAQRTHDRMNNKKELIKKNTKKRGNKHLHILYSNCRKPKTQRKS